MNMTEKETEEVELTPQEKIAQGVELTEKENAELKTIEHEKADVVAEGAPA